MNNNNDSPAVWRAVPVNAQALSLFRILFALLLIFDLLAYVLPHWDFLYSARGVLLAAECRTDLAWSILCYSDHPLYQALVVGVYFLALLGFLFGYHTRLCAFVAFVGLKVLLDRNHAAVSNAEMLEALLLLWSVFMPMDRYWSVAAASRGDAPRVNAWPLLPVLAMRGQILIVYFCSGMFKLGAEPWLEGRAISFALSDDFFGSPQGNALASALPELALLLACWGITALQVLFTPMIYLPWFHRATRIVALVGVAAMHIGFIFLMQLHLFPYLCLCYLLLLVPDAWIDRLLSRRRQRLHNVRLYYDPECEFCRRTALLLREFCLPPGTPVAPSDTDPEAHRLLQQHTSWVVYDANGKVLLKWRAVAYVMKQSLVLFPLGYLTDLPPLRGLMQGFYHAIGNHRRQLARLANPLLHHQPERWPGRPQQWLCLGLILIALSYTLWVLPQVNAPVPQGLYSLARQTGVQQTWDIFAPNPVAYRHELELEARGPRGQRIDLAAITDRHFSERDGYFYFSSPRLLKFYTAMFPRYAEHLRRGYARYLCWQTAEAGTPAKRVKLHLYIRHNFNPLDSNRAKKYYRCDELMRSESGP